MKKRKILSVILSFALITTFMVGCGNGNSSTQQTAVAKSGEMDKTPVTLTFFSKDVTEDMPFDDEVAKKITELTGVTLDRKSVV